MKNSVLSTVKLTVIATLVCAGCTDNGVETKSPNHSDVVDRFLGVMTYTLTTNVTPSRSGSVRCSPNQTNYTEGTTVTVTATAASGYTFTRWSGASTSTNATVTISMNNNKTLTANFQQQIDIAMVYVPGGTFTMGCTSEQSNDCRTSESPSHSVTLSSFYIGKTEVTQRQWTAVIGSNPSYHRGDSLPVTNVSWNDVQTFITTLNSTTGKKYRLPTEAEWEYAARGGRSSNGYKYSGSNTINNVAWYEGNSDGKTHPVGTKQANELQIYDMSGNAFEWVSDRYGNYSSYSQTNPTGPSSGLFRINRGGSIGENTGALYCRVSARGWNDPNDKYSDVGFRLALSP